MTSKPDRILIALSKANTNIGNATRQVWAAENVLTQAQADGDPYEIQRAEADLSEAVEERERSERDLAAAESAMLALREAGDW